MHQNSPREKNQSQVLFSIAAEIKSKTAGLRGSVQGIVFDAKFFLKEQLAFGASFEDITTVKLSSKLHTTTCISERAHTLPTYIETLSLEVSPFS